MNNSDEGYIKFKCDWNNKSINKSIITEELSYYRQKLYELGLIGYNSEGFSFGNISRRIDNSNQFIITGTNTGKIENINESNLCKVIEFDISRNFVACEGSVKASSESLTHGIIYSCDIKINAVIHVHSRNLWKKYLGDYPTTSSLASFGSTRLANEINDLYKETDLKDKKILAMAGHPDGVIFFGSNLEDTFHLL
jgi:L-ribulose-5-phosphate 4-epimerase